MAEFWKLVRDEAWQSRKKYQVSLLESTYFVNLNLIQ